MKRFRSLISLIALVAMASCAKSTSDAEGSISFEVSTDEVVLDVTKSSVSDYATVPQASDFILVIKDDDDAIFWSGKLSEWDSETKIPVGSYAAEASYGSLEEEGFDKPFFTGTKIFTVTGDQTETVNIPVSLGNTIIKIGCTQNFKSYYKDYSFQLKRDGVIASFAENEARAAFVDGYKITLAGTLTTETGGVKTFTKTYEDLAPATVYTVMLDVSGVGAGAVTIFFNHDVDDLELIEVELND